MSDVSTCTKPCASCPWRRDTTNPPADGGLIGGSDVTVYIGQVVGPFWLPCHNSKHYDERRTDPHKVRQCAGAAIFRANINVAWMMPPALLQAPPNMELVFSNVLEMLTFYRGSSQQSAMLELRSHGGPMGLLDKERAKTCAFSMTDKLQRV